MRARRVAKRTCAARPQCIRTAPAALQLCNAAQIAARLFPVLRAKWLRAVCMTTPGHVSKRCSAAAVRSKAVQHMAKFSGEFSIYIGDEAEWRQYLCARACAFSPPPLLASTSAHLRL